MATDVVYDLVPKLDAQINLVNNEVSDYSDNDDRVTQYEHLDLTERISAEIEDGDYSCLICSEPVTAKTAIWDCKSCYRVYHLQCTSAWATKSCETNIGSKEKIKGWNCPSCSNVTEKIPKDYKCWCKKLSNPQYLGLIPHSCGQTCGVTLECGHKCTAICHPGPHNECVAMGPSIECFCGDKSKQLPCIMTKYEGWSCEKTCGELLPCGRHECKQRCHKGLCYDCDAIETSTCYCAQETKNLPCKRQRQKICYNTSGEKWIGTHSCDNDVTGFYTCGKHEFKLKCSSRSSSDFECPLIPKDNETCPCGANLVRDILGHPRVTCEDVIPTCGNVCNKNLSCGHKCIYSCHSGPCPDCPQNTKSHCSCGQQIYIVPCKSIAKGEKPACRRRCTAKTNCGRHRCEEICCSEERAAKKLEKARIWNRPSWPKVHQCTRVCGQLKRCKNHRCTEICHQGPCPPCLESSSEDWVCPCGLTIMRAPIRCGSILPKCPYKCKRIRECGHPMTDHLCHNDDEECPKCFYMVKKPCFCGESQMKMPCSQTSASCGKFCDKTLKCGHKCSKMCHPPGECATVCTKACGKVLPCGHRHTIRCHVPKQCSEMAPKSKDPLNPNKVMSLCSEKLNLQCKCGNLTDQKQCPGETISLLLPCNESCAQLARSRQLAEAFGVDKDSTALPADLYDDDTIDLYLSNPAWCVSIESRLQDVYDRKLSVRRFPPMKSYERMFVHLMAKVYNFKSESQDLEPHRSVVVYADWNSMSDETYPKKPVMKIAEYVTRANI